jgi:L-arabinokinase
VRLGALMYESHASYSACGLGSDGTDRLVALAREAGPARGIYGAKITGGGSGGTVAFLGDAASGDTVRAIAAQYASETGREAHIFEGSSPGAARVGAIPIDRV